MDALLFDPSTKVLSLTKSVIPSDVDRDEVLVKIVYAGICGSDLHILDGSFPCMQKPFTLGHEFCGVVCLKGNDVTHVHTGDRVVIDPNRGCSVCEFCRRGQYNLCVSGGIDSLIGIFTDGGWAQYCKVPARQAHKIPDNLPFHLAILCEPLSCVVHGLDRIAPVSVASRILILGAGIIGNLWTAAFHHLGYRDVIVCEPVADRRALNSKLNTGYPCYSPDQILSLKSSEPHWGVDVCVDCSGSGRAMQDALPLLRPGGKLCIFGVASPDTTITIHPFEMFRKETTIYGVVTNLFSFGNALKLIEAMGSRYLDFDTLGIKIYSLVEYKEAIQTLKKGTISKALFQLPS
ncbi:uncharacterized protein LOC128995239 [Macrosteles quadrilineatus]|uniref:uncharacterized protein LOC128995239 n=1 Tax=Macrosteles quadrilineatus TaxID=74068 RepID=UPI0023E0E10E|nr:uncharacterized protein LOC128995239 [Macrosteles quadrilineatus]XP_054276163.1 uncharacterized protein LOC128995239 [Macrosteles quadrilineatus]